MSIFASMKKSTKEEFITKASIIHHNFYNYDKVDYVNNHTKVIITCPIHGDFVMKPNSHLNGQGCKNCGYERNAKKCSKPFEQFVKEAQVVHGITYKYEQDTYTTALKKMKIICPLHGEFWQTPAHHLGGSKCPECAKITRGQAKRNTIDEFIKSARKIHGDKYDYSKVIYQGNKIPVEIICPTHGSFLQRPNDHLDGKGCPRCGYCISKAEDEIYEYLCNIVGLDNVIRHDRNILNGLEIDILLPLQHIGIEFNGIKWHTEEKGKDKYYHVTKTNMAKLKGVSLIHIFEDEWIEHKELVLNKLKHIVGGDSELQRIGARKCQIKEISKNDARPFLDKFHIQGFVNASVYMGAFYNNKLVSVMTFLKEKDGLWNLNRFASDNTYIFPGLANKIFVHFTRQYDVISIKSFLDRRWAYSNSNVYEKMGFKLEKIEAPDYRYVFNHRRLHKFGFRKKILSKKYGFPLTMTEREMTKELGCEKIWDCGLYKYVYDKIIINKKKDE